ncbi:MAG: bifunctional DNA-formamidopyrimidine glycosylase/DNA-(apurinic or apyrimidinic site) lyase [Acidobacteriota bacterium]
MPELPEVEAVVRRLRDRVVGSRIRSVTAWRCATPEVEELAPGHAIQAVERRAKHILIRLSGGLTLHTHLRMTGNLYAIPDARMHAAGARVVIALKGGAGIVFEDSRALGKMAVRQTSDLNTELEETLGPEPLSDAFTAQQFVDSARASRQPAKLFLMDQRRVAGLGNIYVAEILFRAKVDPRKQIGRLKRARLERLHAQIVGVMRDAVESAWIAYGVPGQFSEGEMFDCQVYDREGQPCLVCGKPIRRLPQGGRSTYFCASCQR